MGRNDAQIHRRASAKTFRAYNLRDQREEMSDFEYAIEVSKILVRARKSAAVRLKDDRSSFLKLWGN
jgi:hypothetical protein